MTSQRKLASRFETRFVQQIWNAILLVHTRETASLIERRGR
ncbi:hypothetical protein [Pararhizobium antarcticum]|nr:hypothetical protein [Pararhizobium antarcticum]